MKKIILVFILIGSIKTFSQNQQVCNELSIKFETAYTEKELNTCYDLWQEIKKSCKPNQTIYQNVSYILQNNYDNALADQKIQVIAELQEVYTLYDKNYPQNTFGNLIKKAMLLHHSKTATANEEYVALTHALQKNKEQYTSAEQLNITFIAINNHYIDKKITLEQYIEKYRDVIFALEKNKSKFPEVEYNNASNSFQDIFSSSISKETITNYAQTNFEANKTNTDWLTIVATLLDKQNPTDPIFEKTALALHQLQPTSTSGKYLANYYLKTKKKDQSVNYYTTAIDLETNKIDKATLAYTVASLCIVSDAQKANQMLQIAIENNPSNSNNYILLATLYANSVASCGTTSDQKNGIYQLAANTVLQAAIAEPRLEKTVQKMAADFLKNKTNNGEKTKSVTIGCWINKTVDLQ